jgi:hypothetical protein
MGYIAPLYVPTDYILNANDITQVVPTLAIGGTYTFSIYVKSDGTTQQLMYIYIAGYPPQSFIPSSSWVRLTFTFIALHTDVLPTIESATTVSSSFYAWGAQLDSGTTPKDYVSTTTSPTSYSLGIVLTEDGNTLIQDSKTAEVGVSATVLGFDYDRNILKLDALTDEFYLTDELGNTFETEDGFDILHQLSGSFAVGDQVIGLQSGCKATIQSLNRANGTTVIGGNGYSAFSLKNNVGLLNNANSVIADNQRYQDYSYTIKSGIPLSSYEQIVRDTVHPAGFALFGDVVNNVFVDANLIEIDPFTSSVFTILYILSFCDVYQSGPEWSEISDLFGDMNKFRFKSMPISMVLDRNISASSQFVFTSYDDYISPPIAPSDMSKWSIINNCQVTRYYGIGPDAFPSLSKLSDTVNDAISGVSLDFTTVVGHTITLELLVNRQSNPSTFVQFTLGTNYINFNPDTGTYTSSANTVLDVSYVGQFWFVRIKFITTATTTTAKIYPSYGNTNVFGSPNIGSTGSVEVANIKIKDIASLSPTRNIINTFNPNYISTKIYVCDTETYVA